METDYQLPKDDLKQNTIYDYAPQVNKTLIEVAPENRRTSEVMTIYEYTEIISTRTKQIESGGVCFTDTGDEEDPIKMAEKELRDKRCPLMIIRHITPIIVERWDVNEMAMPL